MRRLYLRFATFTVAAVVLAAALLADVPGWPLLWLPVALAALSFGHGAADVLRADREVRR